MDYKPVESSNIKALAYKDGVLGVQFHNGTEYRYRDVPACVVDEMLVSASVGRSFNQLIKSKPDRYPYERIQ